MAQQVSQLEETEQRQGWQGNIRRDGGQRGENRDGGARLSEQFTEGLLESHGNLSAGSQARARGPETERASPVVPEAGAFPGTAEFLSDFFGRSAVGVLLRPSPNFVL